MNEKQSAESDARRWRKKPVEIEAVQFRMEDASTAVAFCRGRFVGDAIMIDTLEGAMRADVGDWIIRGVQGEFYPCKPDIFLATYERVIPPAMCRHGQSENDCASCSACAACDGSCGACPYVTAPGSTEDKSGGSEVEPCECIDLRSTDCPQHGGPE